MQEQHVAPLAGEARAVDDLRLAPEHRVQQLGPVLGVVLEVGVLHEHEVAGDVLEPAADRGALAPVALVGDDAHGAVGELAQHVAGAVGAAVVDDEDLELERQLDRAHATHDLHHRVALVEHGHDHRELPEPSRVLR